MKIEIEKMLYKFVEQGKLKKAADELLIHLSPQLYLHDDVILLKASLMEADKNFHTGIIYYKEYSQKRAKLTQLLLSNIKAFIKDYKKIEELNNHAKIQAEQVKIKERQILIFENQERQIQNEINKLIILISSKNTDVVSRVAMKAKLIELKQKLELLHLTTRLRHKSSKAATLKKKN